MMSSQSFPSTVSPLGGVRPRAKGGPAKHSMNHLMVIIPGIHPPGEEEKQAQAPAPPGAPSLIGQNRGPDIAVMGALLAALLSHTLTQKIGPQATKNIIHGALQRHAAGGQHGRVPV